MADPSDTGKAIGDHWPLIAGIGGGLGILMAGIKGLFDMDKALDNKVDARIAVMLANGLGEKMQEMVEAGVAKAMANHQFVCPLRDQLDHHHDRLQEIEHSLLGKDP